MAEPKHDRLLVGLLVGGLIVWLLLRRRAFLTSGCGCGGALASLGSGGGSGAAGGAPGAAGGCGCCPGAGGVLLSPWTAPQNQASQAVLSPILTPYQGEPYVGTTPGLDTATAPAVMPPESPVVASNWSMLLYGPPATLPIQWRDINPKA